MVLRLIDTLTANQVTRNFGSESYDAEQYLLISQLNLMAILFNQVSSYCLWFYVSLFVPLIGVDPLWFS